MLETRNACSVCSNERASRLTCYLLVTTLVICKQFGLNQAKQNIGLDLNSNYLILIVCILTNSTDPDKMSHILYFTWETVCKICPFSMQQCKG